SLLESLVVILFVVDSSVLIVYYEVQGIENEAKTVYCAGGSWTNQRLPRGTFDVQKRILEGRVAQAHWWIEYLTSRRPRFGIRGYCSQSLEINKEVGAANLQKCP
ncbi:hypothetical protein Tco_0699472, partial [Tanacetum coccineum]